MFREEYQEDEEFEYDDIHTHKGSVKQSSNAASGTPKSKKLYMSNSDMQNQLFGNLEDSNTN